MFNVVCCQHSLFAHQTVRTASVLRLTFAAHADEAPLFRSVSSVVSPLCRMRRYYACGIDSPLVQTDFRTLVCFLLRLHDKPAQESRASAAGVCRQACQSVPPPIPCGGIALHTLMRQYMSLLSCFLSRSFCQPAEIGYYLLPSLEVL